MGPNQAVTLGPARVDIDRKWQQGTHFHCETCGEAFLTIERGWLPDEHAGTFDYREHTGHDVVQHHGTDCDEDQEHARIVELWWERYHLHVSVSVTVAVQPKSPEVFRQLARLFEIGDADAASLMALERTLSFRKPGRP